MNSFTLGFVSDDWFFKDSADRTSYYNISHIMSGIKNPTVIHYMTSDHGLGLPIGALPGTKYWSYQTGATPEMKKSQEDAIISQQIDFVINSDFNPGFEERNLFIRSNGYHLVYEHHFWDGNYKIFSKHQHLPIPPSDFQVSKIDILLKRNLFKN
jgi:hypothetical protein